jgi:hypothetical protein
VTSVRAERVSGMRGAAGDVDDVDFPAHDFY